MTPQNQGQVLAPPAPADIVGAALAVPSAVVASAAAGITGTLDAINTSLSSLVATFGLPAPAPFALPGVPAIAPAAAPPARPPVAPTAVPAVVKKPVGVE